MTDLIRGFGVSVRDLRLRHDWSQELLAERADLNRSYLGEIERGEVIPSLVTAAKLASALEISLSELLIHCEQKLAKK